MARKTEELPVKLIKVSDLIIDAVNEEIHFGNVRYPHPKGESGYQRDPYDRVGFIKDAVDNFDLSQLLPLDVSLRPDGRLAIIDGGGRWAVAQKLGLSHVQCRIHTGMSIEDEADLFEKLATRRRPITPVDNFLAELRAGKGDIQVIADAIKPYKVAKGKGSRTLDGVGPLYDIYVARHPNLLQKTAMVIANSAWGNIHLKTNQFAAVALVLDTFPKREIELRRVLNLIEYTPSAVDLKAKERLDGTKARTTQRLLVMAQILAERAGVKKATKDSQGEICKLRDSSLMTALHAQKGIQAIKKARNTLDEDTSEGVAPAKAPKKVAKKTAKAHALMDRVSA